MPRRLPTLPMHICPVAHASPQSPQFAGSVSVLTHVPMQSVVPIGQTHPPAMQLCPAGQTFSHAPQCSESVLVFTQTTRVVISSMIVHGTSPVAQAVTHAPAVHISSAAQAMSQPPQFAASVIVSVHAVPQRVSPVGNGEVGRLGCLDGLTNNLSGLLELGVTGRRIRLVHRQHRLRKGADPNPIKEEALAPRALGAADIEPSCPLFVPGAGDGADGAAYAQ